MLSILYPALVLIPTLLAPLCLSWTFSTTNINLAYPPPLNTGYEDENGHNVTTENTFPCADVPVNQSISRVPFPISGGSFTYALSNTSKGSLKDYKYIIDVYLGQISLGDGTYSASENGIQSGFAYADTEVFKDFATGQGCSEPFDAVAILSNALGKELMKADVVGLNATWGVRIILFAPNPAITYEPVDDYNQETMYQCGYVTFADSDSSNANVGGYCRSASDQPSSSSSSPISLQATSTLVPFIPFGTTTLSTVTSQSVASTASVSTTSPTSSIHTIGLEAGSSSQPVSHTSTVAVGAGVGVSMGASILILGIGFVFLRRRRARRARSGTIGAHVLVSPALNEEELKNMKGDKNSVKNKATESSGSSVHSEPLPLYTETAKGSG